MVAYFLSVTDDKEKYNATLQMFFTINTVSVFLIHVFQGHVSGAMLLWLERHWQERQLEQQLECFVSPAYYDRNQKKWYIFL